MPVGKIDSVAQLIADNLCELHGPQGIMKLTWLSADEQAPIRYAIGEGIVTLLNSKGLLNVQAVTE